MLWLGLYHVRAGTVKFPRSWLWTLPCRQKIYHFFFLSHAWGARLKYLPNGCPHMLMYSVLHIIAVLWLFGCFYPKIRRKFFDFYIFMNQSKCRLHKTWSDRWIKVVHYNLSFSTASNHRDKNRYLDGQTDLLLCTINCFIQWAHPQNMAVGDLAIYYTLYLSVCELQVLVSFRFVTLYATATWISFKNYLLWLIQQCRHIVFSCHLHCPAVQRAKPQTHYCLQTNKQTIKTNETQHTHTRNPLI